jgi:TolB protein
MDADGTHVRKVVGAAEAPDWSPDGDEIVYVSTEDGRLYRVRSEGGGARPIGAAASRGRATCPVWSSDGSRIAFGVRDGERSRLFVASLDRGETRRVITAAEDATSPVWTSDGSHLIFTSGIGRRSNLYAVRADGSERRALTSGRARDDNASWVGVESPAPRARRRPWAWGRMRQISLRR